MSSDTKTFIFIYFLYLSSETHQVFAKSQCGSNEVLDKDVPMCPETCNPKQIRCDSVLATGCRCKDGYVELSANNHTCVPKCSCPANKCGPNQVCDKNVPACPESCNTNEGRCESLLATGCRCKDGYVTVSAQNRTCVSKCNCPKPQCGPNQVFDKGVPVCPESCDPREIHCLSIRTEGCRCKDGYVVVSAQNHECVLKSSCPAKCGSNQVVDTGVSACPANCNRREVICDALFSIGCRCRDGYIQFSSQNRTCVPICSCTNL